MTTGRGRIVAVLVALIAIVWFANLDARRLIRPDEGRYAELAREMAETGDWITPRLNGIKYFEKPPLQYWITAGAYRAFGVDEWTARLWPATAGALTVLLVWRTGRRQFGTVAGDRAGLVAAGMLWMAANAHLNTLDMGFTFWLIAGVAAFLTAQRDDATDRERRNGMWLAWAACAGAVMSKGLAGLVLPGGAIFFYLLASRDWKFLGRLHLLSGVAIVLALCAPWFVAVSIANPEFPDFFFVREHFQRYLTTVHRRTEPWWYFLPLLVAGTLPWTALAARSVWRPWRADPVGARFRPRLFLACWCAFVLLFFSASSSKLPSYILPIFPAVAWLMGDRLDRTAPRALMWTAAAMVPLAIAAGVIGLNADRWATKQTPVALYQAFEPWIVAAAASIMAGSLAAMWLARRERVTAAVATLSIAGLVAWQLAITGHDALSPSFSSYQLASQVRGKLRAECPFYSVRTYEQTLPFYLGRTTTLVEFEDEMAFGLEREPQLAVRRLDDFVAQWQAAPCAYALLEPSLHDELVARGLRMDVMARDTRRVIAGKPATEIRP